MPVAVRSADPLATPARFLKGAGEKRAELLAKLGLNAVDRHLAGERAKPPKGVELFVASET